MPKGVDKESLLKDFELLVAQEAALRDQRGPSTFMGRWHANQRNRYLRVIANLRFTGPTMSGPRW